MAAVAGALILFLVLWGWLQFVLVFIYGHRAPSEPGTAEAPGRR